MAENNKKFNVVSIVILAVLAVALIMGIVGISIAWLSTKTAIASGTDTLKELADANELYDGKAFKGLGAIKAMGIIAIIAAALTLVSYLVSKFVNIKALKFVTIGLALVLIVCSLLALILTFTCTSTEICDAMKTALDAKFMPAAGCWLLSIFGVIGGAAGVYGGIKG